jgi:hypothetical protein
MKSLWTGLYDRVKDRRYGSLYIYATLGMAGICLLGQLCRELYQEHHDQVDLLMVSAIAVLMFIAFLVARREFLRSRRMRNSGSDAAQLSSDEVTKARSKLLRNRYR